VVFSRSSPKSLYLPTHARVKKGQERGKKKKTKEKALCTSEAAQA